MTRRLLTRLRHYYAALGLRGVGLFLLAKLTGRRPLVRVRAPGVRHPLFLRIATTDVAVYRQIFVERQYDFALSQSPRTIVDAGANIGLAAVFFANKYPAARIIAIEPDPSNAAVLRRNASRYPQITVREAALWRAAGQITLTGAPDENDSFRVAAAAGGQPQARAVPAVTVDQIMREAGVTELDLLKLDIEGAEKEVLEHSRPWIQRTGAIMAELHDEIQDGCVAAFQHATTQFATARQRGETVLRENPSVPR